MVLGHCSYNINVKLLRTTYCYCGRCYSINKVSYFHHYGRNVFKDYIEFLITTYWCILWSVCLESFAYNKSYRPGYKLFTILEIIPIMSQRVVYGNNISNILVWPCFTYLCLPSTTLITLYNSVVTWKIKSIITA